MNTTKRANQVVGQRPSGGVWHLLHRDAFDGTYCGKSDERLYVTKSRIQQGATCHECLAAERAEMGDG